jgi:small subunit ribosomal protein S16
MLAIRLQRLGRKAAPVYRLAVQEAQRHPSSGRVVAYVGAYNPHTKEVKLDTEKIEFYLKNGAQPTPRVVKLLTDQKVKLPDWVKLPRTDKESAIRKPEKLRKNQPKQEAAPEEPAEEAKAEESPAEPAEEETKE